MSAQTKAHMRGFELSDSNLFRRRTEVGKEENKRYCKAIGLLSQHLVKQKVFFAAPYKAIDLFAAPYKAVGLCRSTFQGLQLLTKA